MALKQGLLLAVLLVGGFAKPVEDDMSIFFEHVNFDARIVGGTVAAAGSWPWMAALTTGVMSRSLLCSGSIITQRHVLTAAHCINHVFSGNSLSSSLRVTVGTNRWNSGGVHHNVQRNITHPNYVAATTKNDLGFLVTTGNIAMTNIVRTIALNYDFIGANVASRVAGWGRIRAGGSFSAQLMQLGLNTIDGARCRDEVARASVSFNIRAPPVEPHIELCTFHSVNHGTCQGDSGSPLVRNSNNQQIGIVSWGFPCARGAPDMFVRVSAYRNWITASIR